MTAGMLPKDNVVASDTAVRISAHCHWQVTSLRLLRLLYEEVHRETAAALQARACKWWWRWCSICGYVFKLRSHRFRADFSFLRTFVPETFRSLKLSFPRVGPFVPGEFLLFRSPTLPRRLFARPRHPNYGRFVVFGSATLTWYVQQSEWNLAEKSTL